MDAVAPVQIQTMRIGIEFQHLAVFGCRIDNLPDIDRVGFARQKQTARRMGQHRGKRIGQRFIDAAGHFSFRHVETGMHRRDHKVKPGQDFLIIIKATIRTNVRFDPFENVKRGKLLVELVDGGMLFWNILRVSNHRRKKRNGCDR